MDYIAQSTVSNDTVSLAIVGILATCVGGLLWVIKFIFGKMLPIIEDLVKVTAANTKATKSADEYLRQRNGRDNEHHAEVMKVIGAIPTKMQQIANTQAKTLADNLRKLPAQNIEHQTVEQQDVRKSKGV